MAAWWDALSAHAGWILLLVWIAWWLWAVDWRQLAPTLRAGGWAPAVLLGVMCALVWSYLDPSTVVLADAIVLPNLVWQLGVVGLLFALALFCGWLQGLYNSRPVEIEYDLPEIHGHGEDHGHGADLAAAHGPLAGSPDHGHEPH
jgi:hypothetical protein